MRWRRPRTWPVAHTEALRLARRARPGVHLVSRRRDRHPPLSRRRWRPDRRGDRGGRASRARRPGHRTLRALHPGHARALRRSRARSFSPRRRRGPSAESSFRDSHRGVARPGSPSGSRRRCSRDRRPAGSAAPRTGCRRRPGWGTRRRPSRRAAWRPGAPGHPLVGGAGRLERVAAPPIVDQLERVARRQAAAVGIHQVDAERQRRRRPALQRHLVAVVLSIRRDLVRLASRRRRSRRAPGSRRSSRAPRARNPPASNESQRQHAALEPNRLFDMLSSARGIASGSAGARAPGGAQSSRGRGKYHRTGGSPAVFRTPGAGRWRLAWTCSPERPLHDERSWSDPPPHTPRLRCLPRRCADGRDGRLRRAGRDSVQPGRLHDRRAARRSAAGRGARGRRPAPHRPPATLAGGDHRRHRLAGRHRLPRTAGHAVLRAARRARHGRAAQAVVDRYRSHPIRYFALLCGSIGLLVAAGSLYIYCDADKRSSERALAALQFCHLAQRSADEKRALDDQRQNLSSIHETAGAIRQLIDKLPPAEQAKASRSSTTWTTPSGASGG